MNLTFEYEFADLSVNNFSELFERSDAMCLINTPDPKRIQLLSRGPKHTTSFNITPSTIPKQRKRANHLRSFSSDFVKISQITTAVTGVGVRTPQSSGQLCP